MFVPIAPMLGSAGITEAAKKAASVAAASLGGSQGKAPATNGENTPGDEQQPPSGFLARLLGLPPFDPAAAKRAMIQGAVITALVVLFFVGLLMFVGRSVKLK
jgi:hypothetical protein